MSKCHISRLNTQGLSYLQLPLSGGTRTDLWLLFLSTQASLSLTSLGRKNQAQAQKVNITPLIDILHLGAEGFKALIQVVGTY